MANEKAKKKSADKTADKSAKNDKNGKNGKTAAEKTADKATACYNSLKKYIPKKKQGYMRAALNHATDRELEAVKRAKKKSPGFAGVLAITPFGWLGMDRFYIGDILRAITKILATAIIALTICARFVPYFKDVVAEETPTDPGTATVTQQKTDDESLPEEERFTLPAAYVGIWDNRMTGAEKRVIYLFSNAAEILDGENTERTAVTLAKAGEGAGTYYYLDLGNGENIKLEVKSGKLSVSPVVPDDGSGEPDPDPNPDPNPDPSPNPGPGGEEETPDVPNPPDTGDEGNEPVRFTVALEGEDTAPPEGDGTGDGDGTTPPAGNEGEGTTPPEGEGEGDGNEEAPDPNTFVKQMDKGEEVIYRAGVPEQYANYLLYGLVGVFGLYLLLEIFLTSKKAKKDNYYRAMKVLAPEADE